MLGGNKKVKILFIEFMHARTDIGNNPLTPFVQ